MTWNHFCKTVQKTAAKAADKINYSADLASLQVKLSLSEQKLERAYAALGRASYQHFSKEESSADAVAKAMLGVEEEKKAVLLLKARIATLKKKAAEAAEKAASELPADKEAATEENPKEEAL